MTSNEIKALDKQHVMQTYGRFDVALDHGEGARLYSPEGKAYVDFTSGIGVNCLGYGNRKWAEAIYRQALKFGHVSNLFYSEPYVRVAEALTTRTGLSDVFFANGGGEANEGMIKCARKYSFDKYGPGRSRILTLYQSFHGRTVTTLAATGQDVFHQYFFPFTEGFSHIPAGDLPALEAALAPDVCAVMVELVQGEGGVLPLEPGYVQALAALCREKDVLLLVDEVQTGIGRTGSLFAFQQYGILPDVVSFAKGIAGGLPMGGILCGEKTKDTLTPGTHATTFGANPVSSAAASVVLDTLDDALLAQVREKGDYIRRQIAGWNLPAIGTPRGMGLMIGVPLKNAAPGDTAKKCIAAGLLILTAGADTLRILPPLTITYAEIDAGLAILKTVLEELK